MSSRYHRLIEKIFFDRYRENDTDVRFERSDFQDVATALEMKLPKNLGDVIYSVRYRTPMPQSIIDTQPDGMEWIIKGDGRSSYRFKLVKINRILPQQNMLATKIPDATPEIIDMYALSDEQALLAKVRYNRLIDLFLGMVTYSMQNHLRTTVTQIGQIEIDEMYVGVDKNGRQYIIPVQAKGGKDQLSVVQTEQDLKFCEQKYPNLLSRAISAQFLEEDLIVLFELALHEDEIRIVQEKHYKLTKAENISERDVSLYNSLTSLS